MPRKSPHPEKYSHRISKGRLDDMIADATIDCYNDSELVCGFYTMIKDDLAVPFSTALLGIQVIVERIDLTETSEEIVAVCHRGRERQRIPLLDLLLPTPKPFGSDWVEAYRRWVRGQ